MRQSASSTTTGNLSINSPVMILGNVAYRKEAAGATVDGFGLPGSLAVDGNRDPEYSTTGSCAYARATTWEDLYWQVDLGSPHVIYNLTVYGTDGSAINGMKFILKSLINSVFTTIIRKAKWCSAVSHE